jgi:hypothetical protein
VNKIERQEEKEKVLVPVRRREITKEEEHSDEFLEEPVEVKVWEMPKRWYVYR